MERMAKRAILTLLVGALFSSMGVPTPSLAVINEAGPSGVDQPSGWMVWYEDETFEDCGGAATEIGVMPAASRRCSSSSSARCAAV